MRLLSPVAFLAPFLAQYFPDFRSIPPAFPKPKKILDVCLSENGLFLSFESDSIKKPTLVHGNKAKPKRPGLALLRCKITLQIFGLGLIAVQNDFSNFRTWPYCRAPV